MNISITARRILLLPCLLFILLRAASPAAGFTAKVIEVFSNTWETDFSLGLVYDSNNDYFRYTHESGSTSDPHTPCIFDVPYDPPYAPIRSISITEQNPAWKESLQRPTGAAYDRFADTYFIADYNGDLYWHDDYIIEINRQGTVLNAWEMDDECADNGSSDGTEIDSIIDIAVIPGSTPRYFATAAYDGTKVYEISLTRGGGWWAAESWHTVAVYDGFAPELSDNLGIDWDHENERFYHSDWHSTTVVVTDINMEPIEGISRFNCPGAGGYNSGIAFVEGTNPPEIWVTDFTSNQTTRCESPAGDPMPLPWMPLLLMDESP